MDSKQAVGLAVKLPFNTQEEFINSYGQNISRGGIYLRSKALKPPGTTIKLDIKLQSGEMLLHATTVVAWVTGTKGQGVSGMGLKFVKLDEASQKFIDSLAATVPHAQIDEPPLPKNVGPADSAADAVPPIAPLAVPTSATPAPVAAAAVAPSVMPAPLPSGRVLVAGSSQQVSAPAFEVPKEEPKRTGPIIGIDLGTTNSCAAFVKAGRPQVLNSREGYNTVPSILALNARGKLVVGHPAKGQMLTNPRLTVYGAKRLVGRAFDSPVVQQIKDRFHYEVCAAENGDAAVRLGDKVYTLQQVAALILREVKDIAQVQIGEPVSRAVITVPAYYNDNQRQAVRESGRLAGLYVERIVNEPTAAALAYGYGRKLSQRVMVYDLGGGTFDASVLELNDNVYEVLATGGDTFLGGLDFDNAIVAYLLEDFEKKNGSKFQGDRVAMQRITDAAERAKCILSERTETRLHVPFITMIDNKPLDLDVVLTREKLIELTGALVDRTIKVCQEVLDARKLKPSDVNEVILVGGQSRFPLVHERIQAYFKKPAAKSVHPDEAVAVGASILANSLLKNEGVLLIDVLPMAIGVGVPGGRFRPIIERNSALPTKKDHVHATTRDDQHELEVTVFQGDNPYAQDNEYLGTVKLSDLPKGPKGSVIVKLSFEVTNECLLKVTAREQSTGKEVSVVLSTRDTPAEVKKKLEEDGAPESKPATEAVAVPSAGAVRSAEKKSGGFFNWLRGLFS